MIARRQVLKWGAMVPALAGLPAAALARTPAGIDAFLIDRRHLSESSRAEGINAPVVHYTDGDVTRLWFETLDPRWRRPGFVLGGFTGPDVLFVLETLAHDRGRRVVSRKSLSPHAGSGDAPMAWIIAPVHPSVKA
jgi:hypothetical protein